MVFPNAMTTTDQSPASDDLSAAFARAAALARQSDPTPAIAAFRSVTGRWPGVAVAWANLGVVLKRAGLLAEALGAFERAARLAPTDLARLDALATTAYEAGDMRRAASAMRRQLLLVPDHADAAYNLALVLPLIGPRADGVRWMTRTTRIAPTRAGAWDRLARIATAHGRDAVAERSLRRAACLDPGDIDAATDRARRRPDAETLGRLFVLDPDDAVVRVDLAEAQWNAGWRADAVSLLAGFVGQEDPPDRAVRLARVVGLQALARQGTGYERWLTAHERRLSPDEVPDAGPVISIVMPVHNPPADVLRAAIASVARQSYRHWEFCICDDVSTDSQVIEILEEAATRDPRVKLHRRSENGHISRASNDALDLATGEFVTFLDHDDALAPDALAHVVRAIGDGDVDILYSDEDKIDAVGQRFDAFFKPGWDPDRMMYQNVVTHLAVYRRALVERVGRLRVGVEGSQDHDLVLRCAEATTPDRIRHIPKVLYHWRQIEGSTSVSIAAKPYAVAATHTVIRDHLARMGVAARVMEHTYGHRVVWDLPDPAPRIGVVIATRDQPAMLRRCVQGLLTDTDYPALSIAIVDNGSERPDTLALLDRLGADPRVSVIARPGPFNFSALMNAGAAAVDGEILLFLNDDIEVLHADWLRELASQAARAGIGPVGAKLLYPDMRVQHGGVVLAGRDGSKHLDVGRSDRSPSYVSRARVVQSLSAVTGACLALRREVFEALGGFDAETFAVDFADTDLCLRAARAGYRTLWTPFARLVHHESASRGSHLSADKPARFEAEQATFVRRWGDVLERDPYYNVNLAVAPGTTTYTRAEPPRGA
jgi:GT2 family glycosyltransferase/Flp pilus assembly protein TadD